MLKGDTINLRTVREKDLATLFELQSDVEARGDHFPTIIRTETQIKKRFEEDGFWSEDNGNFLIVDAQTDRILGTILFFKPMRYFDAFEVGYILYDKASRNKGITTQAVRIMLGYLFKSKNIHRIQLMADVDNEASKRVAVKSGFTLEGIIRAAILEGTRPRDLACFSILRSEFEVAESGETSG